MRHIIDLAHPIKKLGSVLIMLPGAYQQPEDFIAQGFVNAVRERGLTVDLILAELMFNHIADQTALAEIHQHLILPAIKAGYSTIWLAGVSIGAYIAMAYAQRYPDLLSGVLLLAPYPGNGITISEIKAAGGVNQWHPADIAAADIERGNWLWLKNHPKQTVYLSYGEQDRFVTGQTMMAAALTADQVDTVTGDHSWPVWLQLWQNFLDKNLVKHLARI